MHGPEEPLLRGDISSFIIFNDDADDLVFVSELFTRTDLTLSSTAATSKTPRRVPTGGRSLNRPENYLRGRNNRLRRGGGKKKGGRERSPGGPGYRCRHRRQRSQ
jgi:hypothetical protein